VVASASATTTTSNESNNNNNANAKDPKQQQQQEMTPYVVSLMTRKRVGSTSRNHLLPPLQNERRTSRSSRTAGSHKRSHSATSQEAAMAMASATPHATPTRARHGSRHAATTAAAVIVTPTHHGHHRKLGSSPRVRQINRVDTVRVLRARPAFYPIVRDRYAASAAAVVNTGQHVLNSPSRHRVVSHHGHHGHHHGFKTRSSSSSSAAAPLPSAVVVEFTDGDHHGHQQHQQLSGRAITLRAHGERSATVEMKRKRRSAKNLVAAPASPLHGTLTF
jgi:hypothetical protein